MFTAFVCRFLSMTEVYGSKVFTMGGGMKGKELAS